MSLGPARRGVRYLLATDSVHTTAAACDYLDPRLESNGAVDVLTVVESADTGGDSGVVGAPGATTADHDAADAANVASVRLAGKASVETNTREGDPAAVVKSVAVERDADVVLLGTHGGRPGAGPGPGSVTTEVLAEADRPVVVLPVGP